MKKCDDFFNCLWDRGMLTGEMWGGVAIECVSEWYCGEQLGLVLYWVGIGRSLLACCLWGASPFVCC